MLVDHTANRTWSHLAYFSPEGATCWNGSQSRPGFGGCNTQCVFLELFVYPAAVYVAHREARGWIDVCDLLYHSDHCRQLDCTVEGTGTPRRPDAAGARIRAAAQNLT